jgi:hypothetical protein
MLTRQEMVYQFMLALTENASVQVVDPTYVYKLACDLADEYLRHLA